MLQFRDEIYSAVLCVSFAVLRVKIRTHKRKTRSKVRQFSA